VLDTFLGSRFWVSLLRFACEGGVVEVIVSASLFSGPGAFGQLAAQTLIVVRYLS